MHVLITTDGSHQSLEAASEGALMLSPELERKNMRLGLALFGVFVALFVGACVIALVYLQVD